MKKYFLILFILLLVSTSLFAYEKTELQVTTGWDLRLEVGGQFYFTDNFALRSGIGSSLFTFEDEDAFLILYDFMGVWDFMPDSEGFGIELFAGLIDAYTVFLPAAPETLLSLGGAAGIYYEFNEKHRLSLKGGGGIPFMISPELTGFDPDFFPDLTLSYGFRL